MSSSRLPLGGARPEPRAVLYLSYARLLGFPAEGLERSVRDGTLAAEMAGLHRAAGLPGAPWAVRPGRGEGLEQAYIAAFDAGVPEPPVPLYESAYLAEDAARRRGLLEDLVRFYEFFDLDLGESPSEAPDHLAVELEFLAAVAQLESLADARGGDGAPFRRAQRDFLDRHLVRFLRQVSARPVPAGFYRVAVDGLTELAEAEAARAPAGALSPPAQGVSAAAATTPAAARVPAARQGPGRSRRRRPDLRPRARPCDNDGRERAGSRRRAGGQARQRSAGRRGRRAGSGRRRAPRR